VANHNTSLTFLMQDGFGLQLLACRQMINLQGRLLGLAQVLGIVSSSSLAMFANSAPFDALE
jgi:apolipoprotein N-acyltransferase